MVNSRDRERGLRKPEMMTDEESAVAWGLVNSGLGERRYMPETGYHRFFLTSLGEKALRIDDAYRGTL